MQMLINSPESKACCIGRSHPARQQGALKPRQLRQSSASHRLLRCQSAEASSDQPGPEAVQIASESVNEAPESTANEAQPPAVSITGSILGPSATASSQPAWKKGYRLAKRTAQLVWANAWTVLSLFAICDGVIYLLHRFSHRFTNEVALRFLLPANTSPMALGGNLWFLSSNPDIANFQTGYQWIVGAVFVLTFPISILLRTFAASASQVILAGELESSRKHPSKKPSFRATFSEMKKALQGVSPAVSRLWQVDLLVAVRSIPLQGLSLLLLPLPWTLPRLIALQLAAPLALFKGEFGDDAIKASGKLIHPVRRSVLFPYIGLLVGSKLLAFLGRIVLVSLSPRITAEVPELPIAIYILVAVLTLVLNRVQDLLPFVTYTELQGSKDDASAELEPAV